MNKDEVEVMALREYRKLTTKQKLDEETALDIKKGFTVLASDYGYSRQLEETFNRLLGRGEYGNGQRITSAYFFLLVEAIGKGEISEEEFIELTINMAWFWLLVKRFR